MKKQYYSTQDDISFVPLTREEERELFRRFHEENDLSARDELLRRHLKAAAKHALRTAKGMLPQDDAISAGNLGLLQALEARRFNPDFGTRFETYSRHYIFGAVRAALRFQCSGSPRTTPDDVVTVPADACLTGAHSRSVDHQNTGACTGGVFIRITDLARGSESSSVDHGYDEQELENGRRELVEKILAELPELERAAVIGEFFHQHSFAETGRQMGASREGVRKAFVRGMKHLTARLADVKKEEVL